MKAGVFPGHATEDTGAKQEYKGERAEAGRAQLMKHCRQMDTRRKTGRKIGGNPFLGSAAV